MTVKRSYHSPRRREQAAETRRRVLRSARTLFTSKGYGSSTVEAIADGAGVSAQTIYATFGSKQGILMAHLDQMAEDADIEGMNAAVQAASGNPRAQLRERIAFMTRFFAGGADLIEIARTVSGAEPDLRAMWKEGEARRYRAAESLVRSWAASGALASGLTAEEATDILWALTGPDMFRLLVVDRGWSELRFAAYLHGRLADMLFSRSGGQTGRRTTL